MDGCARAGAVRAGKPCPSGLMAGESRSLESAEMRRIHPVTAPIRSIGSQQYVTESAVRPHMIAQMLPGKNSAPVCAVETYNPLAYLTKVQ
ncbi:MAG: hypothetical protein WCY72_02500 [Lysobacteraceae bacterium]